MQEQIITELKKIDSLIRDVNYNVSMASVLEKAYYISQGEAAPVFPVLSEDNSTLLTSVKEEKIATNLSGFYALECGVTFLCNQSGQTPVAWFEKIVANTLDSNTALLLDRFANATWKAAQPFRDLKRITRPTFTVANFLPQDEIIKDQVQIKNAASKLLASMQDVTHSSTEVQMKKIRGLMQSKNFALEMAEAMHKGYYTSQQQTPPVFLLPRDDTAVTKKSAAEQKVATNVAGFYALECGLSYFATTKNVLPSYMLRSIINDSISKDDKMLLLRFANATWKAGQPFRGLNRIEKENFVPFYFLDETEIEKDMVQIKAAAQKLLNDLR
ncbi:hypothetical protein FRZ67_01530 [Panacibacter ginsenosidivorans]|uniref:Uncharacterized protein n=1 Tax=Panacibacter ginsenosidivorans TaxID=1813871 RepID=A0A5B8V4E3_9BACT|nr:hypothetical protein [Panacibacter ginsenosidivorans]QEC66048.1 hypothetical protein FRZ67_01530 [Panacibacter ginsenosidivorans]